MPAATDVRVLFVSNWFLPLQTGSSFYTASLAQALAARGHQPAVVTLDWGPESAPPLDLPYPVHCLPVRRLPKLKLLFNSAYMGWAWTPANTRRLAALLDREQPEIVHHVNHIFDSTFLSIGAARGAGVPIVGSITTPIQHERPAAQAVMSFLDRWTLGRFGVRRWDGIVCLDRVVQHYVRRQYGEGAAARSVVIPFGVRLDQQALYDRRDGVRAAHPQILFVGHVHPFRNPTALVRAMPAILARVPDARLLLVGRVDLSEPVDAAHALGLGKDQVRFLGETDHAEVVRLMQASHVFANWASGPYRGLGTAPMEAMLCETPVVNDLPEDLFGPGRLKDGENIVLADGHDPQSVAAAILRLLTDEALWRRVGSAGRRFVLDCMSWERIAAEMEAFYARVMGSAGRAHAGRNSAPRMK